MREKYKEQLIPTEQEVQFIELMEHTNDRFGYRDSTISLLIDGKLSARKLRKFKERYNANLYVGYPPKGKIVTIKKLYKLITPDSIHAQRVIMKARHDFICSLIDMKNTNKYVGKIEAKGQMSLNDMVGLGINELIELANMTHNSIEERD